MGSIYIYVAAWRSTFRIMELYNYVLRTPIGDLWGSIIDSLGSIIDELIHEAP